MAYAIMRIQKLKTWGDIAGSDAHNFRQRETPNADAERLQDNICLVGAPEKDARESVKEAIGDQKIRKNAVLAVEMFMSASPEYFRPDNPAQAGNYDPEKLWAWKEASEKWMQEKYGDRIIKSVLHLDETTPHIHAVMVPLDDKGKLNCRAFFGGTRHTMTELQTDYAKAVESLGIERGLQGSRATHQEVKDFYSAVTKGNQEQIPRVQVVDIPDFPGKIERMSDDSMRQFAQKVAAAALTEQQKADAPIIKKFSGENFLMKRDIEDLRKTNAHLSREREQLKQDIQSVKGIPLPEILMKCYGAQEEKDSKPSYQTRKFALPDGSKIATTGSLWIDNTEGKGGKGGIDLVMHLSGYKQSQLNQAVKELTDSFGVDGARRELTARLREAAPRQAAQFAEQVHKEAPQIPEQCPQTWNRARNYLVEQRKLPAHLVDAAHNHGLVYSDRRSNCVFPCDKGSGAFVRGTGEQHFKRTVGQGHLPYVITGQDKNVIVAESAIDALTLKAMHPKSSVIATGGNMPLDRLKSYLDGKAVYLAHDNDKGGSAQAAKIQEAYPHAQRLAPPHGKDWNESWQKEKAQSCAKEEKDVEL
ncbi:plasmid recombination protein [Desulfovibrio sp. OttesenSCG-928-C06]|nr:plasmid recombination protein [Desulfovibrio sp. OttesenSCG-928-C06]